jgi:phosphatidate cytidylyltransferase
MLRTRLWMGAGLVALVAGVLVLDPGPWYPFLLLLLVLLALVACYELHRLLGPARRPPLWLSVAGVLAVLLANWPAHVWGDGRHAWRDVLGAFAAVVLAAFLLEMAAYRGWGGDAPPEPGASVGRIALTVWVVAYLGLLPSFLAQLRWAWAGPTEGGGADRGGVAALALTIFVPKFCDIGAYFTGRLLGRHRMSPVLSPKKTWEGLAGGLAVSVLTAVALNRWASDPPVLPSDVAAAGFGLALGVVGVLGDLAESLIKRDCRQKDASQRPGGVADQARLPAEGRLAGGARLRRRARRHRLRRVRRPGGLLVAAGLNPCAGQAQGVQPLGLGLESFALSGFSSRSGEPRLALVASIRYTPSPFHGSANERSNHHPRRP